MPSAAEPANPATILAVVQAADLARRRLDDGVAHRDLTVAGEDDVAPAAHGQNGGRSNAGSFHGRVLTFVLAVSGARVALVVDGHQVIDVDVSIALRRAEAGVAEHLLDGAQIGALAEQVRGEAVAERVRRDARRPRGELAAGQQPAHGARPQPPAARAQEQRVAIGSRRGRQPIDAPLEIGVGGLPRLGPERHDAILAPLALAHAHHRAATVGLDVAEVEVAGLRDAQPGAVDHLEQRQLEGARAGVGLAASRHADRAAVEQPADVFLAQERRQPLGALGARSAATGLDLQRRRRTARRKNARSEESLRPIVTASFCP